jgi:hypothetical protein
MFGFSPLASVPLGATAEGGIFVSEITFGTPVVENADLTLFYNFAATKIASGEPVVDGISFTQFFNFNADNITSLPDVDTLPFAQEHILAGGDIAAGAPTIPVRFLWDYQEPTLKTWVEVSDTINVWTDVAAQSDTWSNAA